MKNKSVLITGVAGFIGSNLLDYLMEQTDWQFTGLDNLSTGNKSSVSAHLNNSRFKFVESSCLNISSLKEFQLIFHLAALPRIQPSFELVQEHIEANLLSSTCLLDLMIRENHFPKLIYSGSSAVYGTPVEIPTTEDARIDCLSPYAFQKYEVEKYLEYVASRYPLDFVTLRYFNPYGPRSFNPENKFNAYSSVVGIFLDAKRKNKALQVTGDGSQKRDFIHVLDVARANYLAAIHPGKLNSAFNVGAGKTISILKLARLISSDHKFIPKREGEAEITFASITKTQSILGWEPVYSLEEYLDSEINSR